MQPVEIVCSECGEETLLKRETLYDGFKKVGEKLTCSACSHEYADESDVPFKEKKKSSIFDDDDSPKSYNIFSDEDKTSAPDIFSEEDKSKKVDIFKGEEKGRNCRHCVNYIINPFTQKCGLHLREVQATDLCDDFEKQEDEE